MVGNGESPEGGGGGRVSQTNYLDKSILVDIANIQIIAFASIFSLFALSISIKRPIWSFKKLTTLLFDIPESLF